jgi:hypothetical protein
VPGAEAVKQVVPAVELRYFDLGHFVLDEFADAIAEAIIKSGVCAESAAPGISIFESRRRYRTRNSLEI